MKSIERRFKDVSDKEKNLSSLMCFSNAVNEQGFSKDRIGRWFNNLVEKEDYLNDPKTKKELLEWLNGHTQIRGGNNSRKSTFKGFGYCKIRPEAYAKQGGRRDLRPLVFQI